MKVLVTGASGFVGSWLVKKLKNEGLEVRTLSRKSSSPALQNGLEVVPGDVTNFESLLAALEGVKSVFHLAGHVGYSKAERHLMEQIKVLGTENMVKAAIQKKVQRFVHMSSVVAIGASFDGRTPLNEESQFNLHPLDLGYFETKLAAEKIVLSAANEGRLDAVAVNPSTIYGAGDAQKGSRRVQVKVARGAFRFFTSGGVSVIDVEDIVQATYRAWQVGRTGQRYILSGENITIHELFKIIAERARVQPPSIHLPNLAVRAIGLVGDQLERMGKKGPLNSENAWSSILFHWFDHGKAAKELGLKPLPARDAIAKSVDWMKENGYLK